MGWVILFVIIILLGALAGGDSLGETIRKGIGCLVVIFLVLLVLVIIGAGNQG
jgi:hypothetical protein